MKSLVFKNPVCVKEMTNMRYEENQPFICKIFSAVSKFDYIWSLSMRRMHLVVKPLWMSHTEEKEDETDKKDGNLPLK